MTHREFAMLSEESVEKTHDHLEKEAFIAVMNAVASRGKGKQGKIPTPEELYRRPSKEEMNKNKVDSLLEKQKQAEQWLSQFDLKNISRKEDD